MVNDYVRNCKLKFSDSRNDLEKVKNTTKTKKTVKSAESSPNKETLYIIVCITLQLVL